MVVGTPFGRIITAYLSSSKKDLQAVGFGVQTTSTESSCSGGGNNVVVT